MLSSIIHIFFTIIASSSQHPRRNLWVTQRYNTKIVGAVAQQKGIRVDLQWEFPININNYVRNNMNSKHVVLLPITLLCYISSAIYFFKQLKDLKDDNTCINTVSLTIQAFVLLILLIYLLYLCKEKTYQTIYRLVTVFMSIVSIILLTVCNTDVTRFIIFSLACVYVCILIIVRKHC